MKRGVNSVSIILFLILIVPFFSSFVSASLCRSDYDYAHCYNIQDEYVCRSFYGEYGCVWESGYSGIEYNCQQYGYCNSPTAICDQWGSEGYGYGYCYEPYVCRGDFQCSELDDTYESMCENVGCTWYPESCVTNDNCDSGDVCKKALSECSGFWTDTSRKVDYTGLINLNWAENVPYFECIDIGGGQKVCNVCESCKTDRDHTAHMVVGGKWYKLDCNGNYLLGICTSVDWVQSTYPIRSGYATPSCTSYTTESTCLTNHPGCIWGIIDYGICECVTTSYTPALTTFCDPKVVIDNCGVTSEKMGAITCVAPQQCVDNKCIDVKTCTDDQGCEDEGKYCEGNTLIECKLGSDGCLDKTTTSCVDTNICTSDACSLVGVSGYQCTHSILTGTRCDTDGDICTDQICSSTGTCVTTTKSNCCTSPSTCPTGTSCQTRTCTSNVCGLSTITSCINTISDGCCPSGCTYLNDKDCTCTPTKTTCSALDCGNIPNGCPGTYINCGGCDTGEGTCINYRCTCESEASTGCYDNDVYYFDSCGKVETSNKFDECSDTDSCTNDYCSGGSCVNEYICDCTSDSQCNDNDPCTNDRCSSGYCSYTQKSCGTDGDGCCQPGCTYPNDQDCSPPKEGCPDGIINQGWEECDCGTDGICTSAELGGESCTSLGYAGGSLTCSSCMITFGSCTSSCNLLEAYWQSTTTYLGNSVNLIVVGDSNCNGKSITFKIKQDNFLGLPVNIADAPTRTFSGTSVTSTWTPTELSKDGYYFVAELSDGSDKITSNVMEVVENTGCGVGGCDEAGGENCNNCPQDCGDCCPDGKCNYGELCNTCPEDCGTCDLPCGNGECEDGLGEDCYNCPIDCKTCPPPNCGDGDLNLDQGEECDDNNLISGDGCSEYCKIEGDPGENGGCEITEASWEKTTAFEGEEIGLRVVGTTECNGEGITFIVMEKDAFPNSNDPVSVEPSSITFDSSITNRGYWTAEGQEDDDNDGGQEYPPEYYFTAIVTSTGQDLESSNLLEVLNRDVTCSGVNYCPDYENQGECESDLCVVGEDSVVGVSCGSVYNPITNCWDNINCGCSWDAELGICEGSWEAESVCGGEPDESCTPYEDECWLEGDLCTDECECFGTSTPNTYGSCDYTGYDVCDESNECWLAGDHCGDDCFCEEGYPSNYDGTCGEDNPNVCVEDYDINECWLAGDLCTDECECFGTSYPNGYGSCDYAGYDVCAENYDINDCWLAGDHCTEDCICEEGYEPNQQGSCYSEGGTGEGTTITRKKGTCFYTESGGDDCDDGYLTRILNAFWQWDETNRYAYTEIPVGQENEFIPDAVEYDLYRYDPQRESQMCVNLEDTFVCPASVEVPFFGVYQAVIVIAIIGLIYLIYVLKKKNHVKQSKKKTGKTSKKSRK